MKTTLSIITLLVTGSLLASGCSTAGTAGTNSNAEAALATATRLGPDNSDITTSTDASGTRTETRVFRSNQHISKLVVTTTKDGVRTTKVYSRSGEEKAISGSESQNVLEETGDAIADAAGFVAAKTVEGADKAVEVGKDAAGKTKDAAKTVGEKTAEGAKTVADKTAEGAKKTGKAIKKAIKP
ncbi:MAG TPA: hypothetical protein VN643_03475 [Pyrinomonadaceae bacterium]|nr:hypothetical protein [Pyrinomonadaceae bacterium]